MTFEILDTCTGCGSCLSICPVKAISGGPGKVHIINNDLCIGCASCARVCSFSSVIDQDGKIVAFENKRNWLLPHFDKNACRRCGMCSKMCPARIITKPTEDDMPTLTNEKMCASCHMCEKVCAYNAIVLCQHGE